MSRLEWRSIARRSRALLKEHPRARHLIRVASRLLPDRGALLLALRTTLGVGAFAAVAVGAPGPALAAIGIGIALDLARVGTRQRLLSRLSTLAATGERFADNGDSGRSERSDAGDAGRPIVRLTAALERTRDELIRRRAAGDRIAGEGKPEVDRLAVTMQEMAAASQEMAATIDQISGDTAESAESLERATQASEHVSGALREVADGAREAVRLNDGVRELGEEQRDTMGGVSDAVSDLARDVSAAAAQVHDLAESSERIGGFVETIQGITRQTELLALNASIEAARAGEHGRGFAVVAEEVRKLADGASTAAVEIRTVIEETVEAIDQAESMLAACSDAGDVVTAGVQEAADGFDEVVDRMRVADEHMAVAQAGTGEIERQIEINVGELEDLTRGTAELAAAIEQMSSSSQEIAAGLGETAATAESLAHLFDSTFDEESTTFEGARGGDSARDAEQAGRANDPGQADGVHPGGRDA